MNPFKHTPIEVPNLSGHDLSHSNSLTTYVGTITPILTDFLIPGDKVRLSVNGEVSLPPMATDFYGRIQGKIEAFFVPCRIIWAGWRNFLLSNSVVSGTLAQGSSVFGEYSRFLPSISVDTSFPQDDFNVLLGPCSLFDYLGGKQFATIPRIDGASVNINALPFAAYHKIWEDWYRNTKIQRPAFVPYSSSVTGYSGADENVPTSGYFAMFMPYVSPGSNTSLVVSPCLFGYSATSTSRRSIEPPTGYGHSNSGISSIFQNFMLMATRQRNWDLDYFTSASTTPQAGSPSQLAFSVSDSTGSFTISSLRAANALQQWLERNNIGGYSYPDLIKAQYGILPDDATVDRAIYIGRLNFDIYTRGVYQQNTSSGEALNNPFNSTATKYGDAKGFAQGNLINDFKVSEHGFLMVNFTICPQSVYSSGSRRYLFYETLSDIAFPLLQGVGEQPIYNFELYTNNSTSQSPVDKGTFGYTHRYQEYKFMNDEVHGLLSDGQSLSSFALQRSFNAGSSPELSSGFLMIPFTFLDQVSAVKADVSKYGAWCNFWFDYMKVSVLSDSIVPTLGDLKDTHTEYVQQNGRML